MPVVFFHRKSAGQKPHVRTDFVQFSTEFDLLLVSVFPWLFITNWFRTFFNSFNTH